MSSINLIYFFNTKERNIEIKNEEYRMKVRIFNTLFVKWLKIIVPLKQSLKLARVSAVMSPKS